VCCLSSFIAYLFIINWNTFDDNNPMKRYLTIIILLLIILTLAACSGNATVKPETVIIDPPQKAQKAVNQINQKTEDMQKSIQDLNK